MTTLIIARHGNTFTKDQTPTRVGAKTDLPLVEKGELQATALGIYLKENKLVPDVTYSSKLKRTIQTAEIAIKAVGFPQPVYQLDIFNEIDYGPDENKTEEEVIKRIGKGAIKDWDEKALVPDGWLINPEEVKENWLLFADQIKAHDDNETVLVVTSNGTGRFAPYITGDYEGFKKKHNIKLSTGALGIFRYENQKWHILDWNIKPALAH
jgi:probable phosphoglycerate mutase